MQSKQILLSIIYKQITQHWNSFAKNMTLGQFKNKYTPYKPIHTFGIPDEKHNYIVKIDNGNTSCLLLLSQPDISPGVYTRNRYCHG